MTLINRIDELSTGHLKVNLALNFVMLAIVVFLVIFAPFQIVTLTSNPKLSAILYLNNFQTPDIYWFINFRTLSENDCLNKYSGDSLDQ